MNSLRKALIIIIVILIFGGLIIMAIFKPELFKNIWLWIVGLAGLLITGIKRFIELLTPGRSLKEIEDSNAVIKGDFQRIKKELEEAKAKLALERLEHAREIERITRQLEEQKMVYEETKGKLKKLQEVGYQRYMESLPMEERKKLEDDIFKDVDFGY